MPDAALFISIAHGVAHAGNRRVELTRRDVEVIYLLAGGRCVPSTRLAEALRPDADPADAENSLHVAIHRLRARLADPRSIRRERFGYRLGAHVRCDLQAIASDLQACAGTAPLPEDRRARLNEAYDALSAAPFGANEGSSPVGAAIARRIATVLSEITERIGRHELACGAYARALRLADGVIERDPCDESASEIAIRAHLALRDRPGALGAYRTYAGALARELDLPPHSKLRDLLAG
jgi:DNA-binding SARP family transcriptional activator